jgi:DNA-binding XRE family transcriptional regulator
VALRATELILNPRQVRQDLNLSRERMARLLDVSAKTIERWEAQNQLPAVRAQRERLARIQEIARLGQLIYGPEAFRSFLSAPLAEFEGRTALQLIELGLAERVLAALAADYEGLGY